MKKMKIGVMAIIATLVISGLGMTVNAGEIIDDTDENDIHNNDVEPVYDFFKELMYGYLRECLKQANCGIGNYW